MVHYMIIHHNIQLSKSENDLPNVTYGICLLNKIGCHQSIQF